MKLAAYAYNAEPFVWYPSPRVSFIDFSEDAAQGHSIWKKINLKANAWSSPMEILPDFDTWLWVDSRINELTINFDELLPQLEHLDKDQIYGIGKSENGFRTISTGCLAEPNAERNEKLLAFIYESVLPGRNK